MGLEQDVTALGGETARVVDPPARLNSQQKAAVIVRLLLSQEVSPGLDRLSTEHQAALTRAMGTLGPISRATLAEVVTEFTAKLDSLALTAPKGLASALAMMEPHISPVARDGLRKEADAGDPSDPWSRLCVLEPDRLRPLLMSESAEVAAILLSKLSVAKAAALLADLPQDRAQVIAHAVALTATVTPEMVMRIGTHLIGQLDQDEEPAFRANPVERVGAILNAVTKTARETLLDGIETRDEPFAADVRRAIFTFQHIPKRVDPTDVPRILRRVEPDRVTVAIAAGFEEAPEVVAFLLANMSKRLAEQLREEAEALTSPRQAEGEAAMAEIVTAIRALEEEGELRLIPLED